MQDISVLLAHIQYFHIKKLFARVKQRKGHPHMPGVELTLHTPHMCSSPPARVL